MDDRFTRKDKPGGQDVWVSRDAKGDPVLLHRVALDAASSPEARQALLSAARSTISFRHPQVLAVRDVRLEGDSLVFVQDCPMGPLLADVLDRKGPMPMAETLRWMRQIASALQAAETAGLTISQISPTEFVYQEAIAPGVSGGLLCLCPPVPAGWWLEVEDPLFASPEQKTGQDCDIRSALYSAGAVLAAILTRQRPSPGKAWTDVVSAARLPQKVGSALKAVLQVDPGKRCAHPAEWMALLEKAISENPPPAKESAQQPQRTGTEIPQRAPLKKPFAPSHVQMGEAVFVTEGSSKKKRVLVTWLATLGVIILAFGGWQMFPKKAPSASATPPAPVHSQPAEPAPSTPPPPRPGPKNAVAEALSSATVPPPGPQPAPASHPPASPAPPITPEPPKKIEAKPEPAKKPAEIAVAPPVAPKAKPPPSLAPPPAPTVVKAKPATKEELLLQAAKATGSAQTDLYRLVLEMAPNNPQALHGLVQASLSNLPPKGPERDELSGWTDELVAINDPLGIHARGCLALQRSADAPNLTTAIKSATDAVSDFKQSLHDGYAGSFLLLAQASIDLHSFQLQNREKPKADRTSKALLDEIARAPDIVPAKDARRLAARLEQLLKERAAKGPPRMQETFLKTVMQHLYAMAAKRGDGPAQQWVKTHR